MQPVTEQVLKKLIERIENMPPNQTKMLEAICSYNAKDPAIKSAHRQAWSKLRFLFRLWI